MVSNVKSIFKEWNSTMWYFLKQYRYQEVAGKGRV